MPRSGSLSGDCLITSGTFSWNLALASRWSAASIRLKLMARITRSICSFTILRLRCFIVIDLKMQKFKPEFAGKMNFYLSAVDDLLRHGDDQPSIGIILCKTRSQTVAEYALRDTNKPIGIAEYRTTATFTRVAQGKFCPPSSSSKRSCEKPDNRPETEM